MDIDEEEGPPPILYTDKQYADIIQELDSRQQGIKNCYELLRTHGADLHKALLEFESKYEKTSSTNLKLCQLISEKGTLLGIAANGMLYNCDSYMNSAETDVDNLIKALKYEKSRTKYLENMLRYVAKEQIVLEKKTKQYSEAIKKHSEHIDDNLEDELSQIEHSVSHLNTETESFAFLETAATIYKENTEHEPSVYSTKEERKPVPSGSQASELSMKSYDKRVGRRTRVPDRPHIPFSAWSVLKNNIGKDLSKIPMPVNFNEPITTLQRLTEELKYFELLDTAANIEDIYEQLAYLAAFTISAYEPTAIRTNKPFNPLLGETYECDRTDEYGWRSITEQVSHHPPISALHCEGRGWTFWKDFGMTTKFRGKSIYVTPTGRCFVKFHNNGNIFEWNKPLTIVNNIIVGKMWIDQQGEVFIEGKDSADGILCELTFIPVSFFSFETKRRVKGVIRDKNNVPRWSIKGLWDQEVGIGLIKNSNVKEEIEYKIIWRATPLDPESVNYHNFSRFTCELNEMEDGIAPTDSRLRPDVRLMEEGRWDEAGDEKIRLEQKQRDSRTSSVGKNIPYKPRWFTRQTVGNRVTYVYKGTYWEAKKNQNWSDCPDIF